MHPSEQGLTDLYRFACLLAGDEKSASEILLSVTRDSAAGHGGEFRSDRNRYAGLVNAIRERCKTVSPDAEPDEPPANDNSSRLAKSFSGLPEPERTALALFYTDLFTPEEIAGILRIDAGALSEKLANARQLLRETGGAFPSAASAS